MTTRLCDYRPHPFRITHTTLRIDLDAIKTKVSARHKIQKNPLAEADSPGATHHDLVLDMGPMRIEKISLDGRVLAPAEYRIEGGKLLLPTPPADFELAIDNTIAPHKNTALSGLYKSGNAECGEILCTQCEPEGFRNITPSIDRPDNLARYSVTLSGCQKTMPQLLCNGNLVESGAVPVAPGAAARHYAKWDDPHPKPTYLFAIVAGDLACLEDSFVTGGGREVALRFYAAQKDIKKCAHAMAALQRAMAWDEEKYGREYDLDLFNVVAVDDFNMGAMENKSLNIFNASCVLANKSIATDSNFETVEAVIGHEYFHNWSGNRVTCRDWFQLSLKEGFTVFREQQFSDDIGSAAVNRIATATHIRNVQFPEDAGASAHPVRPAEYAEINNFYTATVYDKGAEVVRMLHTMLGAERFRAGADLYFARHDGEAVTIDDFIAAMAEVGGLDLAPFCRWYSQAGTPVVCAHTAYDAQRGVLELTLSQSCPPTADQRRGDDGQVIEPKLPFVIPIRAALFDGAGNRLAMRAEHGVTQDELLILDSARKTFQFSGIFPPPESPTDAPTPTIRPVTSLVRGFSAPVKLEQALTERELALLMSHDDDPFNRWDAGQQISMQYILADVERLQGGEGSSDVDGDNDVDTADTEAAPPTLVTAYRAALNDNAADPALQAEILAMPGLAYIGESVAAVDPAALFRARRDLQRRLARALKPQLLRAYHRNNAGNDGGIDAAQIGQRSLRDACLALLTVLDEPEIYDLAANLLKNTHCMTDSVAALSALVNLRHAVATAEQKAARQALLDDFYQRWQDEPLVVNKWLKIQATAPLENTLRRVTALTEHPAFASTDLASKTINPNKIYALICGFIDGNPRCFHAADGAGYRFASHWVAKIDPQNPQVAARIAGGFSNWRKYTPPLQKHMKTALREIIALPNLSVDTTEIVAKSLQA